MEKETTETLTIIIYKRSQVKESDNENEDKENECEKQTKE